MLRTRLYTVYGVLLLLLIAGSVLSWCMPNAAPSFLALIPLAIGVLAAYLANCFQQRSLFVAALRALWSDAVEAKGLLVRYCSSAGQTDYYEARTKLSNVVDKVRAVYRNIGETDQKVGVRPFEPLMDMFKKFENLKPAPGQLQPPFDEAEKNITDSWQAFQDVFLKEFDRPEPSFFISEFGVRRRRRGRKAPWSG